MLLWRFIWFRSASYRAARGGALLRRWLTMGWRPPLAGLAVIALALVGARLAISPKTAPLTVVLGWGFWIEAAALYAVAWLIGVVYRSRSQLVVLAPANHAGDDVADFAAGLPAELANQVGRLGELYSTFDEGNLERDSSRGGFAKTRVTIDSPGDGLTNVIGEKSAVKLGPLDLPLRPLAGALQRLVSSRRLTTSLHRIGDRLTLLAEMPGRRWRVERELAADAAAADLACALCDMQDELSHRVFVELSPMGTRSWEAFKHFSEGLRAYRRATATPINLDADLSEAESHFVAARGLDASFARSAFNLGVIYQQRDNPTAAKTAFELVLASDPRHVDAAYGISAIYLNDYLSAGRDDDLGQAEEFADRAIAQGPRDWRVWNMKGYLSTLGGATRDAAAVARTRDLFLRAAILAWKDLCRAAWRRQPLDGPAAAIRLPFSNLAAALREAGQAGRADQVLGQAIGLSPDANLLVALGDGLGAAGGAPANMLRAVAAYRSALTYTGQSGERARVNADIAAALAVVAALEPGPTLWSAVTGWLTRGRRAEQQSLARVGAEAAFDRALVSPTVLDDACVARLSVAADQLGDDHRRQQVELIQAIQSAVLPIAGESPAERLLRFQTYVAFRKASPPYARPALFAWRLAILAMEIGRLTFAQAKTKPDARRAARYMRCAVLRLRAMNPTDSFRITANAELASVLTMQGQFREALSCARDAAAQDPFSVDAYKQMAMAHSGLADFDRSEQQLRRSYSLSPGDGSILAQLGYVVWRRGTGLGDRAQRRAEFRKTIDTLSQAISLTKNDADLGQLHYWLGRFHGDLTEYDQAASHYAIAVGLGAFPIEANLYGAWEELEQGLFGRAESHLRIAIRNVIQLRRSEYRGFRGRWSEWLRTPIMASEGLATPGYFLLLALLLLSMVSAGRAGDLTWARRYLRFVERHRDLLGRLPPGADRDAIAQFEQLGRYFNAVYEDYRGWVCHLDGQTKAARKHLEAATRMWDRAEALCHLAEVYLHEAEPDRALDCCLRAQKADQRSVYVSRIGEIEDRARTALAQANG
jgi:tetratricopeptide (TPR) repeat protein